MNAPQRVAREWIGLHFPLPTKVDDCSDPEILVWLELPGAAAVGQTIASARELDVAASFQETTRQPLVGFQRRPKRVRVPTEEMAEALRTLGSDLEVVVAPVPEADEFREGLTRHVSGGDYLSEGVDPQAVAGLFAAAAAFDAAEPWRFADDSVTLCLDAPELGIEGAVVSIMGAGGDIEGFAIHESAEAFDRFVDAACAPDLGAFVDDTLLLTIDPVRELPRAAAQQIDEHGWRLIDGRAPWVILHGPGGATSPRPGEVALVASVAAALASFTRRHGDKLSAAKEGSLSGRYEREGGISVVLSGPFFGDVESDDDELDMFGDEPESPLAHLHQLDHELTLRIHEFGARHHRAAAKKLARSFSNAENSLVLLMPWMAYEGRVGAKPLVELFLHAHAAELDESELSWIHAQEKTVLSIWEVLSVRPGTNVDVRDLLTGERRTVTESNASKTLVARDAVLARVVDVEGECVFVGMHSYSLPPVHAAAVAEKAKRKLKRKTPVSLDQLKSANLGPSLIRSWEAEASRYHAQRAAMPTLVNHDGDPLLGTTDHFAVNKGDSDVKAWLEAQPDVLSPDRNETDPSYRFISDPASPMGGTLIGTASVSAGKLRIECNSVERSDTLRARLETALGRVLAHRLREHSDPLSSAHPAPSAPAGAASAASAAIPNAAELIRDFKNQHYAGWCDEPLPALDGATPRAASRTAAGRKRVAVLLADLENHEARLPLAERYDVDLLRTTLNITE